MSIADPALAERISAYLKATQGRDTQVTLLERIHGGASRETWRVRFDEDGGAYNQADAGGFIKLNALRMRIAANARNKRS